MLDKSRKTLIPFLMAGYPSLEASERLASALIDEGVRVLEIGVPFSDPLADGPVIQKAAERALMNGTKLPDVFKLINRIRTKVHGRERHDVSIVIFSYFNPLFRYGLADYVRHAVESGARATLAVDLPPEEAAEYLQTHTEAGLQTVFLASPTTRAERLPLIARSSTGFIYYVSRTGVTGEQTQVSASLARELEPIRRATDQPVAVGFGVSNPEQAAQVTASADAVVIGSRFLSLIDESADLRAAETRVRALARSCFEAIEGGQQWR